MEPSQNNLYSDVEMGALLAEARIGNISDLRRLLKPGKDINTRGTSEYDPGERDGPTILEEAAHHIQLETMKFLIQEGADVNQHNAETTVLLATAFDGDARVLKLLVDSGADVHQKRWGSSSILHEAVDDITTDNLDRKTALVEAVLDIGFDINTTDEENRTALWMVSRKGPIQMIELLLSRGADINAKDFCEDTPLDIAASGGRLDVMKLLLQNGVRINPEEDGCNGIGGAAFNGHTSIVAFLLDHGAQAVIQPRKFPELFSAARSGNMETVSLLYERGFACQGPDSLREAARRGPLKAVKLLLAQGIDVNAQNHSGISALHCAILGARLHARDSTGDSSGFVPTRWEVLQFLLDQGADVNARSYKGHTAKDMAIALNYVIAVAIIETHSGYVQSI